MKCCPYCGAEFQDNIDRCPTDQYPLEKIAKEEAEIKTVHRKNSGYEIPPLKPEDKQREWVTILVPSGEFEENIVIGRLNCAGIETRIDSFSVGGWYGKVSSRSIQVRQKDYDAAREILNGTD